MKNTRADYCRSREVEIREERNSGHSNGLRSVPHEQLSIFLGPVCAPHFSAVSSRSSVGLYIAWKFHVRGDRWPVKLNRVISFRAMDSDRLCESAEGSRASYVWKIGSPPCYVISRNRTCNGLLVIRSPLKGNSCASDTLESDRLR